MTDQPSPSSPAERSRNYRARKRDGFFIVPIEVCEKGVTGLRDYGFLHQEDVVDREEIGYAIELLMKAVEESGFDLRADWLKQFE